jgi:hypothetical protein
MNEMILPNTVIKVIWSFPYEARRMLFKLGKPKLSRCFQDMRQTSLQEDTTDTISLKAFDTYKCIFVHIPKCAGISLGRAMFGDYTGNHMNIATYQLIFSKSEFESYFKFAFVRNSWDRLVSAYHFLKGGGFAKRDREWASANLYKFEDFEDFVKRWITPENVLTWEHFKPQHRYVCDPNGKLQVDYVGRFENINNDFDYICSQLGIKANLPHDNRTSEKRKQYHSYYSDETREIVAGVYKKDIEMFGFRFDDLTES